MADRNDNMSDANLIAGHEYDGIQEFDNPTPSWWHAIWFGSMLISVVYFYMSLWSPMFIHQTDRLAKAQEREIQILFAELGTLENEEQTIVELMDDEKWMTFGAALFQGSCVSCHGPDGGGAVGPDLLDHHYKNISEITDIYAVINDGAARGAMPAWGQRLHPNEIVLLSAYVAKLRGSGDGPLGPDGEEIAPWPTSSETQTSEETMSSR
ncbi:MAG: c-type cytochrome [Planctomycetota bacterium]